MEIALTRPEGLLISLEATLSQVAGYEALLQFADGLIPRALARGPAETYTRTLAEVLYQPNPQYYPLLAALLVLDAELKGTLDEETRLLPLPAFLSYRASLSPAKFPLETLRLPPLNPGGHYLLSITEAGACLAIRIDLHPQLAVAGHVRLAAAGPTRSPTRLPGAEQRLEWQVLDEARIAAALAATHADPAGPLTETEARQLAELLRRLAVGG